MTSPYHELLTILSEGGVDNAMQLEALTPSLRANNVSYLGSENYSWVRDVFSLIETHFEDLLASHRALQSPRLLVNRPYGPFNIHAWKVTDALFTDRAKYSCLFPGQVLFLSAQFVQDEEDNHVYVPLDFVAAALALSPVLTGGLGHLLPTRLVMKDRSWISSEMLGTWGYKTGEDAPFELAVYEDGLSNVQFEPNVLTIPWIDGGSLTDFVRLAESYPDEFQFYKRSLAKFFEKKPASEGTIRQWFQELDDSISALDVKANLEAKKLRSRGVDVGVGLVVTLSTLLIPGLTPDQRAALTSLFSLKPAYEGLRWILDYRSRHDMLADQKHWMLWRLARSHKK